MLEGHRTICEPLNTGSRALIGGQVTLIGKDGRISNEQTSVLEARYKASLPVIPRSLG
jgi:hypothetical protein